MYFFTTLVLEFVVTFHSAGIFLRTHSLKIHFANCSLPSNVQESLWSPVAPEKILWITPQLVFSFNVLAFWLLEQAWGGRSKCHPPKMSFQLFLLCPSYSVLPPTALKYLWYMNKVLALPELLKMPRCSKVPCGSCSWRTAHHEQSQCWTPVTSDWGTWEVLPYADTQQVFYVSASRGTTGEIHTHQHFPFSPLQSWISQLQTHSMNSRSSDRISPWQIPHALTTTSQAPCNPSKPLQCSTGWIQHPRAQSSRGVCSPQSQSVKTCLSVNIHWILIFLDYISLKLVILSKMDVFRKARWQVGTSSKRSSSWKTLGWTNPEKDSLLNSDLTL